ncbi:MAG TPA: hypothetical protein PK796_11925, partial [Bacteroidales bacterium]|nr:hypothetical protein [Bacteroidales bacterium]
MKKLYLLLCAGLLLVMAASAQPSSGNVQPLQQYSLQIPSVNNNTGSVVMKPADQDAPTFYFDSLNVTYRGSW